MEFILHTITRLLKPHDKSTTPTKLKGFMKECEEFCENSKMESKNLKIPRTLEKKKAKKETDLHCIPIHLHGKVSSHSCFFLGGGNLKKQRKQQMMGN